MDWRKILTRKTPWLDLTASLGSAVAWDNEGAFEVQRRPDHVLLRFTDVKAAGGTSTNLAFTSLPPGFQAVDNGGGTLFEIGTAARAAGTSLVLVAGRSVYLLGARAQMWALPSTTIPAGHLINGLIEIPTDDPFPAPPYQGGA